MAKTSFTAYTVALMLGLGVFTIFNLAYGGLDQNTYDLTNINESVFASFGNLTDVLNTANETASESYATTADRNLFDVIGGLLLSALTAIKSFIFGVNALQDSVSVMFTGLKIAGVFIGLILSIITIKLAGAFIFRTLNKTDDEP